MRHHPHRFALVAVLTALALPLSATAALAGTASSAGDARAANLCSAAKSVALSLSHAPSAQSLTAAQAQAQFKSTVSRLLSVKSTLVNAAPHSLKGDLNTVFNLFTLMRADLSKVHWNFAALAAKPTMLRQLEAAGNKANVSFSHLKRYFRTTCHFK